MVASALGVRVRVSPEQRHKESKELQQARGGGNVSVKPMIASNH